MQLIDIDIADGVAVVRFDRGGKANALNGELIAALTQAAQDVAQDASVRAVVLTGTARIFAAGVDLKDPLLWAEGADDAARVASMAKGGAMVEAWRRVPQPVIAAIEGPAIGGGAILALAADFRVMAASAYLRFPEVKLGMTLGWGGLALLLEAVGAARAKRILFDDETLDGAQAQALGLCDRFSADGAACETARLWAQDLAQIPELALRMTKASIDAEARGNWAAGSEVTSFYLAKLLAERAK